MKVYRVTSSIDRASADLRWGMTGKAHIIYRHKGPVGKYWLHKFYKLVKERVHQVL